MRYETDDQRRTIQRYARLGIQLNGAVDTGVYDHLSVPVVIKEIRTGDIFALLKRELPPELWEIVKLTDVDRHTLTKIWKMPPTGSSRASVVALRSRGSLAAQDPARPLLLVTTRDRLFTLMPHCALVVDQARPHDPPPQASCSSRRPSNSNSESRAWS